MQFDLHPEYFEVSTKKTKLLSKNNVMFPKFFNLWLQRPITITKRHHTLWMCTTLCCHLIILFTFCFITFSDDYEQHTKERDLLCSTIIKL